jgi:hypothetical protein
MIWRENLQEKTESTLLSCECVLILPKQTVRATNSIDCITFENMSNKAGGYSDNDIK